jgi:hypothetical protein
MILRIFEDINARLRNEEKVSVPNEAGLIDAIPKFLDTASLKVSICYIIIFSLNTESIII